MNARQWYLTAQLALSLAVGASVASAGELADLHRQLADSGPTPLQRPDTPPGGGAGGGAGDGEGGEAAGEASGGAAGVVPGIRPLQPLPQREPLPPIERVGYEASRCRGFCRAFTVILAADGTFSYLGEANVERLGEHSGRVDAGAMERLLRYVAEIDYRGLDDTYVSPFADVQTTYTMVDFGAEVKVVQDQGGAAPATVWALGRLIEDLLEDASWD